MTKDLALTPDQRRRWLDGEQIDAVELGNPHIFGQTRTTQTTWLDSYRAQVNAENLACQQPPVKDAAKSILASLKSIEQYLYWSIDPEESAIERTNWTRNMIEQAHELVDQAHLFRNRLVKEPTP